MHGQVTKEDAEAALRVLNYALFAEEHKATVGGSKGGDDNGPSADPAGESAHSETVGDAAPPGLLPPGMGGGVLTSGSQASAAFLSSCVSCVRFFDRTLVRISDTTTSFLSKTRGRLG